MFSISESKSKYPNFYLLLSAIKHFIPVTTSSHRPPCQYPWPPAIIDPVPEQQTEPDGPRQPSLSRVEPSARAVDLLAISRRFPNLGPRPIFPDVTRSTNSKPSPGTSRTPRALPVGLSQQPPSATSHAQDRREQAADVRYNRRERELLPSPPLLTESEGSTPAAFQQKSVTSQSLRSRAAATLGIESPSAAKFRGPDATRPPARFVEKLVSEEEAKLMAVIKISGVGANGLNMGENLGEEIE
ncbi:telomerase activating protein Est1 [Striga asiatica]|uniref:Telomerase activating protein Est1 n=1 Tax=Striga asiatica TaxID=4170 RepID=A0A5A7QEE0_STRAF|nr:telomerase activating protein Est1 [Striga asiatica]